jgi:hypothetical protein
MTSARECDRLDTYEFKRGTKRAPIGGTSSKAGRDVLGHATPPSSWLAMSVLGPEENASNSPVSSQRTTWRGSPLASTTSSTVHTRSGWSDRYWLTTI